MVVLATLVTLTAPVVATLVLTASASPSQAMAPQLSAPQAAVAAEVTRPVLLAVKPVVKPVTATTTRTVASRTRVAPTRVAPTRVATRTTVTRVAAKPAAKPAPKPASVAAPRPASTSNDYPWRSATTNDPDTWGFTKRQCVSFAAFRLAQHGKALDNASQHWDSALNWDETAARRGVAMTKTPRVGAIAHWNAGESSSVYADGSSTANGRFTAGGYGHVGYVAAVYGDGSALIEQYNLGGSRSYSVMRMTAPRYLVF